MSISRDQLHTLDLAGIATGEPLAAVHPGEILLEDFLKPLGLSQYQAAKGMGVPALRINQIVHGKRAITADTALRLARYFGGDAQWWLRLQAQYDVEQTRQNLGKRLEDEVTPLQVQAA